MSSRTQGILMIAHGSRRAEANQDLLKLSEQVATLFPKAIVESAFLELTQPAIPQGLDALILAGAQEIILFPYFLSMGVHVVDDLEKYRQEYASEYPGHEFKIAPPLGLHPLMLEIVKDRIFSCL